MTNDTLNPIDVAVGGLIRARRQKLKLTQQNVADLSDGELGQTAIANYERGDRSVSIDRLIVIARVLGCSPCSLIPKNTS